MRTEHYFASCGAGKIHYCRWTPEGEVKAVLQIIHGIAELAERYDAFARYLNSLGYLVVAEDHMGHGQSLNGDGLQGYFHGGWFYAVADTYHLMEETRKEYPDIPYILFGHSMGSFMARTILCKYPDSGISAAIICGTGWQPTFALPALIKVVMVWAAQLFAVLLIMLMIFFFCCMFCFFFSEALGFLGSLFYRQLFPIDDIDATCH